MIILKSDYSPVYELINGLVVYKSKKNFYDLGKDWSNPISKKMEQTDPSKELESLRELPELGYFFALIWLSPHKSSIDSFIKWLKSLSKGEIYELLAPFLSDGLPGELGEYRDQYVRLLELWNETYSIEPQIDQELQKTSIEVEEKINAAKNALTLIEELTNGLHIFPDKNVKQVVLIPSHHITPLNMYFCLNSVIILCYPVDLPPANLEVPPLDLVRLTRALGDEKRLQILRIIASGTSSLKEIAKEANLSKSNLHYHLSLLRVAGLIRIMNDFSETYDSYQLRPERLNDLHTLLSSFVLKK